MPIRRFAAFKFNRAKESCKKEEPIPLFCRCKKKSGSLPRLFCRCKVQEEKRIPPFGRNDKVALATSYLDGLELAGGASYCR
jgi:hypothetical protein